MSNIIKNNITGLHWKDEYNGKAVMLERSTGKVYLFPWSFDSKYDLDTGTNISISEKEKWVESKLPTINQIIKEKDLVEYNPSLIGIIFEETSPEKLHEISLREFGIDIPVGFFSRAMEGWLYDSFADKQYINVNNGYFLYTPSPVNRPRVEIYKYFENCAWMNPTK